MNRELKVFLVFCVAIGILAAACGVFVLACHRAPDRLLFISRLIHIMLPTKGSWRDGFSSYLFFENGEIIEWRSAVSELQFGCQYEVWKRSSNDYYLVVHYGRTTVF